MLLLGSLISKAPNQSPRAAHSREPLSARSAFCAVPVVGMRGGAAACGAAAGLAGTVAPKHLAQGVGRLCYVRAAVAAPGCGSGARRRVLGRRRCRAGWRHGTGAPLQRRTFFMRYVKAVCCCARPVVEGAQARLRPVPLLGSLAGKAAEILFGITQYYTYTSAS